MPAAAGRRPTHAMPKCPGIRTSVPLRPVKGTAPEGRRPATHHVSIAKGKCRGPESNLSHTGRMDLCQRVPTIR